MTTVPAVTAPATDHGKAGMFGIGMWLMALWPFALGCAVIARVDTDFASLRAVGLLLSLGAAAGSLLVYIGVGTLIYRALKIGDVA